MVIAPFGLSMATMFRFGVLTLDCAIPTILSSQIWENCGSRLINVPTAVIIAGALVASGAYLGFERADAQIDSSRYEISAADGNAVWRLETTTGEIDRCLARSGNTVTCGPIEQ